MILFGGKKNLTQFGHASYTHTKLRSINPHNATHYVISRNPRERIFIVQISLLIATFLSLISQFFSLMQTIKEVKPHPHIAPCIKMWSVTFLFLFFFFILCHLLNVGACICHIAQERPSGVDHTTSLKCCTLCYSIVSHATLVL